MAVDDRYKRGSASSLLIPGHVPLVQPNTAGVDDIERQAVSWMYCGIEAAEPAAPPDEAASKRTIIII